MADVNFQIRRNQSNFNAVITGGTARFVNRILRTAQRSAVQRAPHSDDTIRPAGHIRIRGNHFVEEATPIDLRGRLGNRAPHAIVVHEGRGALTAATLTSHGQPFRWRNSTGVVRARQVRAASAQPWLVDAYNAARVIHGLRGTGMSRNRSPV